MISMIIRIWDFSGAKSCSGPEKQARLTLNIQGSRSFPRCHRARGRKHPGQVARPTQRDKQPSMLTFPPMADLASPVNLKGTGAEILESQKWKVFITATSL